jgi:hypothetical protein
VGERQGQGTAKMAVPDDGDAATRSDPTGVELCGAGGLLEQEGRIC